MTNVVLVLIGLTAGALSGMVGVGGGIVIVPALVLLLGFSQKTAQGTVLAMLAMPVGLLAAYTYWRAGFVHIKAALLVALGFAVSSFISARYAVKLPEQTIVRVFGGILLLIAAKMLIFGR